MRKLQSKQNKGIKETQPSSITCQSNVYSKYATATQNVCKLSKNCSQRKHIARSATNGPITFCLHFQLLSTTIATVDESIMKTNDTVVPLNSTEQVIDSFYFYEVSLLLCYVESLFFILDGNTYTKSLENYDQNKNIFVNG